MSRILVVLTLVVALVSSACDEDPAEDAAQSVPPAGPTAAATPADAVRSVNQLVAEATSLVDERVTVAGELGLGISPHVALLDGALYATEDVLLVSRHPAPGAFPARAPVRASGVLSRFDASEAERRTGAELDEEFLDQYQGDLVLYAEDLHFFLSGPNMRELALDLIGRDATVSSTVEQAHHVRLFSVEGGLLVLLPDAGVPPQGTPIEATGTLRMLTPALLRHHAIAIDEDLEGDPVLIADALNINP